MSGKVVGRGDSKMAIGKTVAEFLMDDGKPDPPIVPPENPNKWGLYDSWALVWFTDGTGLLYLSSHSGPYSEVTPDIDFYTELWAVERTPPKQEK